MLKKCLLVSPWLCLSAILIIGVPLAFKEDRSVNDPIRIDAVGVITTRGGSNPEMLEEALQQVRNDPNIELPPSWWADLINDKTYPDDHREHCLVEYFRRYVATPISVEEFGRMPGMRDWLAEGTVREIVFGRIGPPPPIPSAKTGETELIFDPFFDKRGGRRVLIWLNVSLKAQQGDSPYGRNTPRVVEFLQLLRGKESDPQVQITAIGCRGPWEYRDLLGN